MEKPKAAMTASVPINETGIVMNGMTTARKFCKNKKITKTTSKVVSKNVISTSWMEASITSVVSKVTLYSTPSGKELPNSFILAFTTFFVILKNWNERKGKEHTAEAVTNRFNREASAIQEAQVFGMVPPAIPGLGASGGLQLQLEDRKNLGPTEMQHAVETLLASYRSKPQLLNLSCMYQANTPQYLLKIDRDKVQMLGLQLNQVFSTLSYYMYSV